MRILFSPCHYFFDEVKVGSEISWAFNIADRIATKNLRSVVVCQSKKLLSQKPYQIIEIQKDKKEVDLGLGNSIEFNLTNFLVCLWQTSKRKYDIIHHVLPFGIDTTFNLAVLLKWTKKTPTVIGPIQGPLIYADAQKLWLLTFFHPVLKFLSRKTLLAANKIIAVNKYAKRLLVKSGISPKKIIIIPPGIDTNQFQVVKKQGDLLQVITIGHLIKRKAVNLILMAMAKAGNSKIRLTVVGDGPERRNLESLTKELNLEESVEFVGAVPYSQVAPYYQRANLFVSMSRAESFGQVYLEAMASGLPVITTINSGSVDIIDGGKDGYLIDQEDFLSLSERLNYLEDHKTKIVSMGRKARQKTLKKYDWDKVIIPKYLKLYSKLI